MVCSPQGVKEATMVFDVACLFPFVFKSCSRCHYYINFLPTQLFPHLPAHHNYNTPSSSNCFWLHLINLPFHKFLPRSPLVEYLQNLCWFFLFNWPNISLWLAIKPSAPKLFANYRSPKPLSDSCPVDYPVNLGCSRFGASSSNRDKDREQHNFACVLVTCDGLTLLPFWWQIDWPQTVLKTFFDKCHVLGWHFQLVQLIPDEDDMDLLGRQTGRWGTPQA